MNDVQELPVRHRVADATVAMPEALLAQQRGETGPAGAQGVIVIIPDGNEAHLVVPDEMSDERLRNLLQRSLDSLG